MENPKNNKRAILGLILVIVGFALIAANFNLFPGGWRHIVFSWQALLILLGLFFLLSREANATGWILIGIGGFFMIPRFWDVPWGWHELLDIHDGDNAPDNCPRADITLHFTVDRYGRR